MSNSRKFRRQLEKSEYVQTTIRNNVRQKLQSESRMRILFGERKISKLLIQYEKERNTQS
jgi:DNA-dependent RNA polymerase auxiliary subunit epsilon